MKFIELFTNTNEPGECINTNVQSLINFIEEHQEYEDNRITVNVVDSYPDNGIYILHSNNSNICMLIGVKRWEIQMVYQHPEVEDEKPFTLD